MSSFDYLLMTPGPVRIPDKILLELAKPMIHHRTPEFEGILQKTLRQLKEVFKTQQPVLIQCSTGSGAMESALVNTLSPGDEVVAIVSGKFGERWAQMARAFQYQVHEINVPWGEAVKPEVLQKALQQHPHTQAVLCQACETSTAVLHPIQHLSKIIKENSKALFLVDGITAIGVTELSMDEWGIDVLVGGAQKSFMLPTGLSFLSFSPTALEAATKAKTPRYYWDIQQELLANKKGQTFFSSPVSHIRALSVALDILLEEGIDSQITKFNKLAKALRASAEVMGLKNYSQSPSPSVTALLMPASINSEKLREHLENQYNLTLMGGQDSLKEKILRIGTMGNVSPENIEDTLKRLALGLNDFGHPTNIEEALQVFRKTWRTP